MLHASYQLYFLKKPSRQETTTESFSKKAAKPKKPRICCPLCQWEPDGKPYWGCEKCWAIFDTFKTHAHCPNKACGNSWADTMCIACKHMSRHKDWYTEQE